MINGIGIGLIGAARSGKDSVAERLVHAYEFRRFAFADRLKAVCNDLFPEEMAQGKNRALLQSVGQAMRGVSSTVWINALMRDISGVDRVVVTDVRLSNEYVRLQSEGFYLIRVNCPLDIRIQRMREAGDQFSIEDLSHETETYIDTFTPDFEVDNSGKVADTWAQIDVIMREIFAREAVERDKAVKTK